MTQPTRPPDAGAALAKWGGIGCVVLVAGCFVSATASASGCFGALMSVSLIGATGVLASGKLGNRRSYAVAPAVLALASVFGSIVGMTSRMGEQQRAEQAAVVQQQQVAAAAARAAACRSSAPSTLQRARAQLEVGRAASAESRFADAVALASQARAMMQEVVALRPPVAGAAELDAAAEALRAQAEQSQLAVQAEAARVAAEARALESLDQVLAEATSLVRESPGDDVIDYDRRLRALAQVLGAEPAAARERAARDIDRRIAAIDRRRSGIRRQVERAEQELAALALYRTLCGSEPPTLSAWDGELVGSERVLAENANDPDSIDVERCTTPVLTRDDCWATTCQVRGRNAFGGLVLNHVRFSVAAHGRILSYRNL